MEKDLFALLVSLGVALTRVFAVFAITPIFSSQVVPSLVRNSAAVAFGVIVLTLQSPVAAPTNGPAGWVALFAREAFIGVIIGFFFGAILWAFESVGQIIDAKIGPAVFFLTDPMSGESTTVHGAAVGRIALFVFMISGGLGLLVRVLLSSYVIWPIAAEAPHLNLADSQSIGDEFGRTMAIAVGFAAPALVILTALEGGMGLVNRFVPQLNVFATSLSIKSLLATIIVVGMLGLLVETVVDETAGRSNAVLYLLRAFASDQAPPSNGH